MKLAAVLPHPPLLVPSVGRGSEDGIPDTVRAYRSICRAIAEEKPDRVVIVSSHVPMYKDLFLLPSDTEFIGNFRAFGDYDTRLDAQGDPDFLRRLMRKEAQRRIPYATDTHPQADHATAVPLFFLQEAGLHCPIVRVAISGLSLEKHWEMGRVLAQTAKEEGGQTAFIASGDLSHVLKETGPYGYKKEGPAYDAQVMQDLRAADFSALLDYDESFLRNASECGHRTFVILGGALEKEQKKTLQSSYEGPFGVGYGTVLYEREEKTGE
ncbi:MAG: AmmeMemoRadiSam system protein B [Tissierellia bacterium]|jgi:AmmeMemoRadiSam system protein B|nr:AmmeMemoRadiSam system protein B [Bacillota bacterium]NLK58417.1 AmmeMemoRadiSam system protein B [Tissierellia bacterium]